MRSLIVANVQHMHSLATTTTSPSSLATASPSNQVHVQHIAKARVISAMHILIASTTHTLAQNQLFFLLTTF